MTAWGVAKDDWYSINVQAGQALYLQSSTPSDQGGQFPNTASLEIELYDTYGNLVAVGTKLADGRNEALFFNAPVSGQYHIRVHEDPGGAGEYYLSVNTAQYPSGDISGQVYNDLNGSGSFVPGDPGLDGWEVDVYDSNDDFVASQLTAGSGNFNFQGSLRAPTRSARSARAAGHKPSRCRRTPTPSRSPPARPPAAMSSATSRTSPSAVRCSTT